MTILYPTFLPKVSLFVALLLPFQLFSATITWDGGGGDRFWDNPLNWDSNSVPTAADDVVIASGFIVEIRFESTVAKAIDIQSNGKLTVGKNAELTVEDSDNSNFQDGIQLLASAHLQNRGIIKILNFENEGINVDEAGAKVDNYKKIIIDGAGDNGPSEGIELDEGAFFNNFEYGTITISNTNNEVFCSQGTVVNDGVITLNTNDDNNDGLEVDDAPFTNNGTININVDSLEMGEPLDIDDLFKNNGIINITGARLPEESIIIQDEGILDNSSCGIINTVEAEIEVESGGMITNDGIITTDFTGNNPNDGTFTNNGEIITTDGLFLITPNALGSTGVVKTGAIPTITPGPNCSQIPTMSQWGLIIFALLVLNLGIVFIYRQQQLFSKK